MGLLENGRPLDSDDSPFSGLGLNSATLPTHSRADTNLSSCLDLEKKCKICLEVCPQARFCVDCPVGESACADCLKIYFTTAVNDALYAMPVIHCPLCRKRLDTAAWAPFVDEDTHTKYLRNAVALLSIRCPDCDDTASFFVEDSASPTTGWRDCSELRAARQRAAKKKRALAREDLWIDMLTARAAAARRRKPTDYTRLLGHSDDRARSIALNLVDIWHCFHQGDISADDFVRQIVCAWPPVRGTLPAKSLQRVMCQQLPQCIEDNERRLAIQLAWLRRYPRVKMPCCKARVCFKCKVRGWHPGQTCEERQRHEAGHEAQFCPGCGVPTARSEGCDQIRCVCGKEWKWQKSATTISSTPNAEASNTDSDQEDDEVSDDENNSLPLRGHTAMQLACLNPATPTSVLDAMLKVTSDERRVSANLPGHRSHLQLAVLSRNAASVRTLLEHGSSITVATLFELTRIASAEHRCAIQSELQSHCDKLHPASLYLWEQIYLGIWQESPTRQHHCIGTIDMTALRQLEDMETRKRLETNIRLTFNDEWVESLKVEAATESLLCELRDALQRKRRPDCSLLDELLVLGANPLARELNDVSESDESDSEDDNGARRNRHRARDDEDEHDIDMEAHNDVRSDYWTPVPSCRSLSAVELLIFNNHYEAPQFEKDDATNHFLSKMLPPGDDIETGSAPQSHAEMSVLKGAAFRRVRLLIIALKSRNSTAVSYLLRTWGIIPVPSCVWEAFWYMGHISTRGSIEADWLEFVQSRIMEDHGRFVQAALLEFVPVWILMSLAKVSSSDDELSPLMDMACTRLRKALPPGPASDAKSNSDRNNNTKMPLHMPIQVLMALHRCSDQVTHKQFDAMLREVCGDQFQKLSGKAATRELLMELRDAYSEKRPPDIALATRLLSLGASPTAREHSLHRGGDCDWIGPEIHSLDNDESVTPNFRRNALDLLAMNRHVDPDTIDTAIHKLVELKADPSRWQHHGHRNMAPLALAIKAHNIPAVSALLHCGAELTARALEAVRAISQANIRHQMEDVCMLVFQENRALTIEDVGLWAAVQCGFKGVVARLLGNSGGDLISMHAMMALRRCRSAEARIHIADIFKTCLCSKRFATLQAEAASVELALELYEALRFTRAPDELLVMQLLELGATPFTTPDVGLDDQFDGDSDDADSDSDQGCSNSDDNSSSSSTTSDSSLPEVVDFHFS